MSVIGFGVTQVKEGKLVEEMGNQFSNLAGKVNDISRKGWREVSGGNYAGHEEIPSTASTPTGRPTHEKSSLLYETIPNQPARHGNYQDQTSAPLLLGYNSTGGDEEVNAAGMTTSSNDWDGWQSADLTNNGTTGMVGATQRSSKPLKTSSRKKNEFGEDLEVKVDSRKLRNTEEEAAWDLLN